MDTYKIALQKFINESSTVRAPEDKCEVMQKRFKFKRTKEGCQLYLIYGKEKFDLGTKTELDVGDCGNALAFTRILCQNLLNKL